MLVRSDIGPVIKYVTMKIVNGPKNEIPPLVVLIKNKDNPSHRRHSKK